MYDTPESPISPIAAVVVLAIIFVGSWLWRKFHLGRFLNNPTPPDSGSSAELLSFFTKGNGLLNVGRGTIEDIPYSMYITMPSVSEQPTLNAFSRMAAIYVLDLPFNTQSHFVGITKDMKSNRDELISFLLENGMEQVALEGDFGTYFDIFAVKGQQFEVRYVLDPEAMQTVIEYCRSHLWEINNAELYFVSTDSNTEDVPLIQQSQEFIKQIRPALLPGMPGAAVVHHNVPYGEYQGPPLDCPLCHKTMLLNVSWFACPDGEGLLLTGADLASIRNGQKKFAMNIVKQTPHGVISCPNCKSKMVRTNYNDSEIMIDSCTNCPFRWLDAAEIAQIKPIQNNTDE